MLTHAMRDAILETADGASLAAWTGYCGLITAVTDFRAGTVTEATYTGYGTRPSISLGAVGNTSPTGGRQKANDVAVTFPTNTGANQDAIAWGMWTADTGGTLRVWGMLDDDPPILGTADTADLITAPAHGLAADQRVYVLACPGAVIPTGLSENVAYYVLASGLTTDAFKLSTSSGGAAVNITASGAALFMPYKVQTIATNATPAFGIGTLVWQL
jgi:hypothetical protein